MSSSVIACTAATSLPLAESCRFFHRCRVGEKKAVSLTGHLWPLTSFLALSLSHQFTSKIGVGWVRNAMGVASVPACSGVTVKQKTLFLPFKLYIITVLPIYNSRLALLKNILFQSRKIGNDCVSSTVTLHDIRLQLCSTPGFPLPVWRGDLRLIICVLSCCLHLTEIQSQCKPGHLKHVVMLLGSHCEQDPISKLKDLASIASRHDLMTKVALKRQVLARPDLTKDIPERNYNISLDHHSDM